MNDLAPDVTDDAALGGRLKLLQPRRGHRFGHDAILLAAATPAKAGDLVVDLGAGVGTAALAVAARVQDVRVAMVEVDAVLTDLASRNAARNGFAANATIATLDVAATPEAFAQTGLGSGIGDCVIMNPPFHDAGSTNASPNSARRLAHVGSRDLLATWVATAERLLREGGSLTLIYRADAQIIVSELLEPRFGGLVILPVLPKPDSAAIRVIVGAIKGSGKPPRTLPGLCLNDAQGRPAAAAEEVLRRAAPIRLDA